MELPAQLVARLALNRVAILEQLEHRALVGHVAEIGAEHRVEGLGDQLLDVAEPLDHVRGLLIVDMDDDRQRQGRFIGVLGDQVDRAQAFVVAMGFGPAGDPVQDEVGRRHEDDVAGIGIEGILAGPERLFLHAALAFGDALAVAEPLAREVLAAAAVVADHHADIADRHDGLGDRFDAGEPAIDEVGAVGERNVLQAPAAAGPQERLGVLEVVVEIFIVAIDAHRRRDDLAGRQRRTVVHRHDADAVDKRLLFGIERVGRLDRAADDHRVEPLVLVQLVLPVDERLQLLRAAGFQAVDGVFGHDGVEGEVDRVDAFAQDRALATALTQNRLLLGARRLAAQEAPGVLKVVARNNSAQRLARRQGLAVAGVNVADLALRHRDQGHLVDAELPPPEPEMQTTAQHLRLKPGLAIERDDPSFGDRSLHGPEFFDDPDPVVGDIAQTGQLAGGDHQDDDPDDPEQAPRQVGQSRQKRRRARG